MTRDTPISEHLSVYRRLRAVFGDPGFRTRDAQRRRAARAAASNDPSAQPFGVGRDPRAVSSVLDSLTTTLGWDSPLARAELVAGWADIVGADNAAHSTPIAIEEGVLHVRCDSSAWAQQLRLMRNAMLGRIAEEYPAAGVENIRVTGPDAPTWKRGPRSVPGRGPRDTYG